MTISTCCSFAKISSEHYTAGFSVSRLDLSYLNVISQQSYRITGSSDSTMDSIFIIKNLPCSKDGNCYRLENVTSNRFFFFIFIYFWTWGNGFIKSPMSCIIFSLYHEKKYYYMVDEWISLNFFKTEGTSDEHKLANE